MPGASAGVAACTAPATPGTAPAPAPASPAAGPSASAANANQQLDQLAEAAGVPRRRGKAAPPGQASLLS